MIKPVWLDGDKVIFVDQLRLPVEESLVECRDYQSVATAIKTMVVRGAPAIGISAAYGLYLASKEAAEISKDHDDFRSFMNEAADYLANSRPTAVNLFWAIKRMLAKYEEVASQDFATIVSALQQEALDIAAEDEKMNYSIGEFGNDLILPGSGVLTHCNAGALATGGYGTALGVIRAAHENNKNIHVFVDETRPFLQGARLTAWELKQDNIPFTLITDNMAGYFMKQGRIQAVVVGADRIAANGDVANKIGTYSVAILAKEHGIPFYVAAPVSTLDLSIASGDEIVIEQRDAAEVTSWAGIPTAPEGTQAAHPAFDVTPNRYITAIITDRGVVHPPYQTGLQRIFKEDA